MHIQKPSFNVNILYLKCLWKSWTNWSTTMISFEKSRTPKEQNKWGLTVNIEAVWWHTPYLMMFYLVENMVCEISKLSCTSLQQTSSLWFPKKIKSKLIAQKCINFNKSMINWFCYDQIMKVFRVNIKKIQIGKLLMEQIETLKYVLGGHVLVFRKNFQL